MMNDTESTSAVSDAAPEQRRNTKTWAATALLFGGLGLILLGGCFLVGMLITTDKGFNSVISPSLWAVVLAILGLGCFCGAVALIVIGAKSLLRIIHS